MAKDDPKTVRDALVSAYEYDADTGVFSRRASSSRRVGTVRSDGYLAINVAGSPRQAHRLAWLYIYGEWPKKFIDHINGNRLDNRLSNLRDVDQKTNNENSVVARSNRKHSKLVGAYLDTRRNRWFSSITCDRKPKFLGYFNSDADAHRAYMAAKVMLHSGFVA